MSDWRRRNFRADRPRTRTFRMISGRSDLANGFLGAFGNPFPPSEKPLSNRSKHSKPYPDSRSEIFYRRGIRKCRVVLRRKADRKRRNRARERSSGKKDARSPTGKRRTDGGGKNGRIRNRKRCGGLGASNVLRTKRSDYERRSNAATASEAETRKAKSTPTALVAAEGENSKNDTERMPPHTAGNATMAAARKAAAE